MTKFWAICRNTFLQTIRQPIYIILLLVMFLILGLDLPLANWAIGGDYHEDNQKLLEQLGLSTLLIFGLLQAAFAASSAMSREIEDKTALTVAAKPVPRATFVVGKFGGVALAVGLAYLLGALVFLMTIRHKVRPAASDPHDWPVVVLGFTALFLALGAAAVGNFVFGWTFTSALTWLLLACLALAMAVIAFVGKGWKIVPFGHDIRPELLVGVLLTFLAVLVFCSVAVAASTRFGQAMTLLICFAVHAVGLMHPHLFGRWSHEIVVVRLLGWLAPNMTYFDTLDALTADLPIPGVLVGFYALYAALYITGVLAVGVALFHGRELEAQATSSTLPALAGLLAGVGRAAALAAVGAGLVILSLPAFHTLYGVLWALSLLAGGAAGWIVWGAFGRGRRWGWWVVFVATAAHWATNGLAVVGVWQAPWLARMSPPLLVFSFVLTGAVLLVLLLPKTRRHFVSERGQARGAAQAAATGWTFAR